MSYLGDILQPAFPVKLVTCEYLDNSSPPATAEEYLQRVVLEAAECEDIMVAEVNGARFASKQTPVFNNPPGCVAAPPHVAPSSEWQRQQAAAFSSTRRILARTRALAEHSDATLSPPPPRLPDAGDEKGWHRFCFGPSREALAHRAHQSDGVAEEGNANDGTPPLVSVILQMNQPTVEHVLEHHVGWLQGLPAASGVSAERGRWLYALLAALELPLTPDLCFLLRSLARRCASLRASAQQDNTEPEAVTTLNLLICIVALYFRQGDLADT